jgi:hypothetical protein
MIHFRSYNLAYERCKALFFIFIPLLPYSYGVEVLNFLYIYTQSVALLGRVISPSQARNLSTGQHKQNKRAHPPNIHTIVGFERTITASRGKIVHTLYRSATVTGYKILNRFKSMQKLNRLLRVVPFFTLRIAQTDIKACVVNKRSNANFEGVSRCLYWHGVSHLTHYT